VSYKIVSKDSKEVLRLVGELLEVLYVL